jgi:TBC1 domain family protein 5
MPENTYFRQPETQNMLLDILFIYTKLNPDVGYRQGMHELLAPVVWVVERDAVQPDDTAQTLHHVLDAKYVEHDTFAIFAEVMKTGKSFYDPAGVWNQNVARVGQQPIENDSAMLVRCRRIVLELLPQYDPGLAAHLDELDISPQLFLMYEQLR